MWIANCILGIYNYRSIVIELLSVFVITRLSIISRHVETGSVQRVLYDVPYIILVITFQISNYITELSKLAENQCQLSH